MKNSKSLFLDPMLNDRCLKTRYLTACRLNPRCLKPCCLKSYCNIVGFGRVFSI